MGKEKIIELYRLQLLTLETIKKATQAFEPLAIREYTKSFNPKRDQRDTILIYAALKEFNQYIKIQRLIIDTLNPTEKALLNEFNATYEEALAININNLNALYELTADKMSPSDEEWAKGVSYGSDIFDSLNDIRHRIGDISVQFKKVQYEGAMEHDALASFTAAVTTAKRPRIGAEVRPSKKYEVQVNSEDSLNTLLHIGARLKAALRDCNLYFEFDDSEYSAINSIKRLTEEELNKNIDLDLIEKMLLSKKELFEITHKGEVTVEALMEQYQKNQTDFMRYAHTIKKDLHKHSILKRKLHDLPWELYQLENRLQLMGEQRSHLFKIISLKPKEHSMCLMALKKDCKAMLGYEDIVQFLGTPRNSKTAHVLNSQIARYRNAQEHLNKFSPMDRASFDALMKNLDKEAAISKAETYLKSRGKMQEDVDSRPMHGLGADGPLTSAQSKTDTLTAYRKSSEKKVPHIHITQPVMSY